MAAEHLEPERTAFGPGRVAHAPMRDHGLRQRPAVWAAACFAGSTDAITRPEPGKTGPNWVGEHRGQRENLVP